MSADSRSMKLLSVANPNTKAVTVEGYDLAARTRLLLETAAIYECLDCGVKLSSQDAIRRHQTTRPLTRRWFGLRSPLLGECLDTLGDALQASGRTVGHCHCCDVASNRSQCLEIRYEPCQSRSTVCIECFFAGRGGTCPDSSCRCEIGTLTNPSALTVTIPQAVIELHRLSSRPDALI